MTVHHLPIHFTADCRPVITRPFHPGNPKRIRKIVQRISQLSEAEVEQMLARLCADFGRRHNDLEHILEEHYQAIAAPYVSGELSRVRRLLIGSYFTMEYSLASAAVFNPSIVKHRYQENLPAGAVRFLLSLRATGEGHISCVVFRSGIITAQHEVHINPPKPFLHALRPSPHQQYDKALFLRKLRDIGVTAISCQLLAQRLSPQFTWAELQHVLATTDEAEPAGRCLRQASNDILRLVQANYELQVRQDADASEVVIFPSARHESHGIEDLRMVRFEDDNGESVFFGTYTASDGQQIRPQLMETRDFMRIDVHTLHGRCARNKGLALFPRRIAGHYAMCARLDGENLYLNVASLSCNFKW